MNPRIQHMNKLRKIKFSIENERKNTAENGYVVNYMRSAIRKWAKHAC